MCIHEARCTSEGSCLQDAEMEESVTGSRVGCNDDEDDDHDDVDGVESESEEMQRHVDFAITEDADYGGGGESGKPNRLHRRDTPHHLKNKRIHSSIDKDEVASIIAQVSPLHLLFVTMGSRLIYLLLFIIMPSNQKLYNPFNLSSTIISMWIYNPLISLFLLLFFFFFFFLFFFFVFLLRKIASPHVKTSFEL
jgi:hypothetical protein